MVYSAHARTHTHAKGGAAYIVARKKDDGVVISAGSLDSSHNRPDGSIHLLHAVAEGPPRTALAELRVGELRRMDMVPRHEEEPRLLRRGLLLNEAGPERRVAGRERAQIGWLLRHNRAVPGRIVKQGQRDRLERVLAMLGPPRALAHVARVRDPEVPVVAAAVGEILLALAQVPLARHCRGVPPFLHHLGQRRLVRLQAALGLRREHAGVDAKSEREPTGLQSGPARGAHMERGVPVHEKHALVGELREGRRLDRAIDARVAVGGVRNQDLVEAQVVSEEDEDVGQRGRWWRRGCTTRDKSEAK